MKIVVPPPDVPARAPFANDKLRREPFANALTNLVQNLEDPTVITINAPWGEGKTTFSNMWRAYLTNHGCRCIYIDAFANDYLDDPFIAMVGEIASYIKETYEMEHPIQATVDSLIKKASHAGVKLLSFGAKMGLKAATLGILKDEDFKEMEEIKDAVSNDSFDFASNLFEGKLRSHRADVATIEDFKTTLGDFAIEIRKDTNYPLVIIIDELDRCRPTYSVDFIEKIKHLFSVNNLVFTLILNKEQLAAAVSSIYGEKIDSVAYLQKFFTIETTIDKNIDDASNDYRTFCNHIYGQLNIDSGNDINNLQSTMICLSEVFCLSLRDIEKCYTHISLYYASKSSTYNMVPLIPLLIVLKVKDYSSYEAFRVRPIFDVISTSGGFKLLMEKKAVLEKHRVQKLIPILKFCTFSDEQYQTISDQDKEITKYEEFIWNYSFERTEIIPMMCRRLDMFNLNPR